LGRQDPPDRCWDEEAERRFGTSYPECAILAERAVKLAVRWMFTHDAGLALPYREAIARLIHEPTLKKLRPAGMNTLVHYILHLGNVVAYRGMDVSREEALLALRGLHAALSWLAACYEEGFSPTSFNESFLPTGSPWIRHQIPHPMTLPSIPNLRRLKMNAKSSIRNF